MAAAGRFVIGMPGFYIGYLLAGASYLLLWWWMPSLALLLFLLMSAYHFGQSNFSTLPFVRRWDAVFTYLTWGAAVIIVPVLFHWQEASVIVSEITGVEYSLGPLFRDRVVMGLASANLVWLCTAAWRNRWPARRLLQELVSFLLLMALFLTTPLLLGFAVYFFFWHSAGSVIDQVEALCQWEPNYGFGRYGRQVLPFSLLAFVGLGLLYLFLGSTLDKGQNLGTLFIFIAIVTVPHTVLMEFLYRRACPTAQGGTSG
ncbi:MAG: hypothetical protein RLY31_2729 [Bacteroidota bacterium]|jgi:Brp/Blh family beta-carotene 15,15'-monooxygenase